MSTFQEEYVFFRAIFTQGGQLALLLDGRTSHSLAIFQMMLDDPAGLR